MDKKQIGLLRVEVLDGYVVGCGTLYLTEEKEDSNLFILNKKKLKKFLEKNGEGTVKLADEDDGEIIISFTGGGIKPKWSIISESTSLYVQCIRIKPKNFICIERGWIIKFCGIEFQFNS